MSSKYQALFYRFSLSCQHNSPHPGRYCARVSFTHAHCELRSIHRGRRAFAKIGRGELQNIMFYPLLLSLFVTCKLTEAQLVSSRTRLFNYQQIPLIIMLHLFVPACSAPVDQNAAIPLDPIPGCRTSWLLEAPPWCSLTGIQTLSKSERKQSTRWLLTKYRLSAII